MESPQFEIMASGEARHWWFVGRRGVLCAVVGQVLTAGRRQVVVDVGCGTGGNTAALNETYTAVGVDRSPEAIELAQSRFPGVQFYCHRELQETITLLAQADLILLADVLEHVQDDREMLAALVYAARPGAYFLVTVPADMRLWSRHDESHGHYRRYDRAGLEELWQGLPVRTLLLSYFNARLYWLVRAVRGVNRWRGKTLGEADTDLAMPPRWLNALLAHIFSGEQRRLLLALRHGRPGAYRRGVSLLALLRRWDHVVNVEPVT